MERLCPGAGAKAVVVIQSVAGPLPARRPVDGELRVVVLAHLREVKDPLLAARTASVWTVFSTLLRKLNSTDSRLSFPASILEKSRMSFSKWRSESAECLTIPK